MVESGEQQFLENSRFMMQTARASRLYTTKQIAPLLDHEQSRVDKANDNVFLTNLGNLPYSTVTDSILRGDLHPLRDPDAPAELLWAAGA